MAKTGSQKPNDAERMAVLAKAYLDMLEKQLSSTLTNPQFVESMLAGMQAFTPKASPHDTSTRHASTSSESRADAILRLEKRIVELERTVAELRNRLFALRPESNKAATKRPTSRNAAGRVDKAASGTTKKKPSRPSTKKTAGKKPAPRKR